MVNGEHFFTTSIDTPQKTLIYSSRKRVAEQHVRPYPSDSTYRPT